MDALKPPVNTLVIGNVTVDETYAVASLPVVGDSLIGEFRQQSIGGKGANQAIVMGRCGLPVSLLAAVGNDERSRIVLASLSAEPLQTCLHTAASVATDLSLIYTDAQGDNGIVTTTTATRALPESICLDAVARLQPGGQLVLQGNLPGTLTLAIIDAAVHADILIALNPSPVAHWQRQALQHVHTLILNETEAQALTGMSGDAAVHALLASGPSEVVLTLGEHGMLAGLRRSSQLIALPAKPASVADTTGAGDTFLAVALASARLRGVQLDSRALQHATEASVITISRPGTLSAFPTVQELQAILSG